MELYVTKLFPTPFIIIQQRLHHNDLVGFVLNYYNKHDSWEILSIPAIGEDGNSLFEARISTSELLSIKELAPETFWTQYQQKPEMFTENFIFVKIVT